MRKGIIVAALHLALVLTLVAKYEWDRASCPRAWARTMNFDPNLPIRGRYVNLRLAEVNPYTKVRFSVAGDRLVATPAPVDGTLVEPIAFFIPEHVADPSRLNPGEELWVELTVPSAGMPRPLRLGVKKDGVLTPLALR